MTPPLSPESRQQLQTLAEAAKGDNWTLSEVLHYGQPGTNFWYVKPITDECAFMEKSVAEYIAAAHPQTVLALLSALAAQEAENERLRQAMTALEKRWRADMLTNKQFANRQTDYWQKQLADAQAQTARQYADELAAMRQSLAASTPEQK